MRWPSLGAGKWQRRDPSPGSLAVQTVLIMTLLCHKSIVESYEKVLVLTEALSLLLSGFRYQTLQCYQTARSGAPTPLFPRVVLTKYHKPGDLTQIYFLRVLAAGSPKSRCCWGLVPSEGSRG